MSTTPEGLILPFEPPVEDTAATTHANIPSGTCYPTGQFVRFMDEFADDAIEGLVFPDGPDIETALTVRDISQDILGACGRVCFNGCRLAEVLVANSSPLQVELSISDSDRGKISTVGTFLEQTISPAAEEVDEEFDDVEEESRLDRQAEYVKGVVDVRVRTPFNTSDERAGLPEVSFDDSYYTAVGQLSMSNFHVINLVSARLLQISDVQQTAGLGPEVAIERFGIALDDPLKIGVDDLHRLLLHPDRDFHFILNLKSTPRSEIFPQA